MHLRDNDQSLVPSIFMPIALMKNKDLNKIIKTIGKRGFLYEYYDQAAPRSLNGYPMFFSCQIVGDKDSKRVLEVVKLLENTEKKVIGT